MIFCLIVFFIQHVWFSFWSKANTPVLQEPCETICAHHSDRLTKQPNAPTKQRQHSQQDTIAPKTDNGKNNKIKIWVGLRCWFVACHTTDQGSRDNVCNRYVRSGLCPTHAHRRQMPEKNARLCVCPIARWGAPIGPSRNGGVFWHSQECLWRFSARFSKWRPLPMPVACPLPMPVVRPLSSGPQF